MRDLPKKLKIGGHGFKIKIVEFECDDRSGHCDDAYNEIKVSGEACKERQWSTLFHEVIHAINGELSEKEVEYLAQSAFQVLKDNGYLDK